jgi:hypothetical protein
MARLYSGAIKEQPSRGAGAASRSGTDSLKAASLRQVEEFEAAPGVQSGPDTNGTVEIVIDLQSYL